MADPLYHPDTCAYCSADTWCEIRKNGKPQCRACKVERFFSEILYPPLGITLMDWTRKIIRDLYGTVVSETGLRQYRHAYLSMAKQNGKTYFVGGLPIYHLLMENEEYPEAYGTASSRDQAGLVFKAAMQAIDRNSDLRYRFRILESTKRILRADGGGSYIVLSADGRFQDGIRPSLLIKDELHRWRGASAKTLYDVATKGQKSRNEPLDIAITTAGAEYESPLWFNEYTHAKNVLSGVIQDPSYYASIFEADAKRIESEPEYWKSREARVAANPSHEDLGGFLKDSAIVDGLNKALLQPAEKSSYLRYDLNIPVTQEEDPIIDMVKWQRCDGGVDLRTWPAFDETEVELLLRKWNLVDKPCYAGIDASWTTDFTALSLIFPPFPEDKLGPGCKLWTLLPFIWIPQGQVVRLEHITGMPLASWIERGFLKATEGNAVDQRAVIERILWAKRMFDLKAAPYDRCNFRSEALSLKEKGVEAIEIEQTFKGLSQATKKLLEWVETGSLRHGNHPVANWMASCLQLQHDHKDNCQPSKPERSKSKKRIDVMQALITGVAHAIMAPPKRESVYGRRGIVGVGPDKQQ